MIKRIQNEIFYSGFLCVFFQMGILRKGKINILVKGRPVQQTKLPMLHQPCHQWLQICPHRHCHCHPGRQSCHQKPMPNSCFSPCWDYSNLEKLTKKVSFDNSKLPMYCEASGSASRSPSGKTLGSVSGSASYSQTVIVYIVSWCSHILPFLITLECMFFEWMCFKN